MRYVKYIIFNPRSSEYPRNLIPAGESPPSGGVAPIGDASAFEEVSSSGDATLIGGLSGPQNEIGAQLEAAGRLLDSNQVEEALARLTALRDTSGSWRDIQATGALGYLLGLCHKKRALLKDGEANWVQAMTALEEALDLVHATHDVQTYAVVYNDLGFVYQSLAGFKERKEYLVKAQTAFEKARFFLEQWEKNADPQEDLVDYWLGLYHLGNTYNALGQLTGTKQHYQTAISFYEEVIRNCPDGQFQSILALARYSLGFAYHTLAEAVCNKWDAGNPWAEFVAESVKNGAVKVTETVDAEENRNRAKSAYQAALTVFNAKDYPLEYSHTQNCLATLYLEYARAHHLEEYLNQAVIVSKEVLPILTSRGKYPIGDALLLHNLGSACKLYSKIRDNEKLYLQKAMYYFEAILKIENLPPAAGILGSTHLNLGLVYSRLAAFKNELQYLTKAVGYFESALEFYSAAADPVRTAITQTNLGDVYLALGKTSEPLDLILKSLAAYREAGRLFKEQHRVADYANNQAKLGDAYLELAARNQDEADILKAMKCYQEGLQVLDRGLYPEEYERIQAHIDETRQRLEKVQKEQGPQGEPKPN